MPRNGSGSFTPPAADFPAVATTLIESAKFNSVINDISTALTNSISVNGETTVTADLPMNGKNHTNVGDADLRNEYAALGQVQDQVGTWCGTAGGTANAITLSPTPGIPAYKAGQIFRFKSGASANTGPVTFAISGLAAIAGQVNYAACAGKELAPNQLYEIIIDPGLTSCQLISDWASNWRLKTYTIATLPTAGYPGREARVSDGPRGVWRDDGTRWVSKTGYAHISDFGGVGDWDAVALTGTDNSQAIKDAMLGALSQSGVSAGGGHYRIHFGPGKFRILSDKVFNANTGVGFADGFIVEGEGLSATQLVLDAAGSAKYFYNNDVALTQQRIFVTFQDIMFRGVEYNFSNGFKFQQDQGWKFYRCWFQTLFNAIESRGGAGATTVGSEHKFFSCKFTNIRGSVHVIDNEQGLNYEYHSCDIESILGNIFYIGAGGGGALRYFGGSIIMDDNGVSDTWLLYIVGTSLGSNNNTYTFNGIQTELRSVRNKLVFKGTDGNSALVTFNQCNMTHTNGDRQWVDITSCRVTFNGCVVRGNTYIIRTSGGGVAYSRMGDPGSIIFNQCHAPSNLSTLITTGSYGYASARGNFNSEYISGDEKSRWAMDFDLNAWNGSGRASAFPGLKTHSAKPQLGFWPFTDASYDYTLYLQDNALVKNIYVFRPANGGGGAGAYQLHVGNGDKTVTYGSSTLGVGTDAHTIIVERPINNLISGGTTSPNNRVMIWANPTNASSVDGGYFLVEYY